MQERDKYLETVLEVCFPSENQGIFTFRLFLWDSHISIKRQVGSYSGFQFAVSGEVQRTSAVCQTWLCSTDTLFSYCLSFCPLPYTWYSHTFLFLQIWIKMTLRFYIHPKGEMFAKSDRLMRSETRNEEIKLYKQNSRNHPVSGRVLNGFSPSLSSFAFLSYQKVTEPLLILQKHTSS